jgi:hypothetical protein
MSGTSDVGVACIDVSKDSTERLAAVESVRLEAEA